MVSVCFGEQGLNLPHGMNIRRHDAKARGRIDGPKSNMPDVTKLHGVFPAGMDLLEGLRCGSSLLSRLKAVPRSPVQIPLSPP